MRAGRAKDGPGEVPRMARARFALASSLLDRGLTLTLNEGRQPGGGAGEHRTTPGEERSPGVGRASTGPPSHFADRLAALVEERRSRVVLGLDPDPAALWPGAAPAGAVQREPVTRPDRGCGG